MNMQHASSHTKSTSHLKKNDLRRKRRGLVKTSNKKRHEKKGTVLTHTVNKISQTPNAPLIQHGKSHTKSTSHLSQNGAQKKRSISKANKSNKTSEKKKHDKKGTVLTHTINKISQAPSADAVQHAVSHTKSASHLKQTGTRKRRAGNILLDC